MTSLGIVYLIAGFIMIGLAGRTGEFSWLFIGGVFLLVSVGLF